MPTFPKRLTLNLLDIERDMLDYLADRLPQKTATEIVRGVFARGLAVLVAEERWKRDRVVQGLPRERSGLDASGAKIPFSKPKYRKPSPIPDPLSIRLDDDLRDRLERLLLSERGSDLESLIETALRVGLDESTKPGAVDPAPVFEQLKGNEASGRAAARERRRKRVAMLQALAAR